MGRTGDQLSATILHVSDTQFGRYHRFDRSDSLAGYLIQDVERLITGGLPQIDLVVLSGDIAERGKRAEYEQARAFSDEICNAVLLEPDRIVVVPGNHDVSWNLCEAVFAEWADEHDEEPPPPPYARKWKHYRDFVSALHGPTAFTEDQPYRLHRFDDLRVIVAAMNSTIRESHEQHYGFCGRDQLRWFADQLSGADGYLRIGVLHHNARRRAQADNENLRDEDDLTEILNGHLDLLLHGHTHEGKEDRLADGTLILATGSSAVNADWRPAEVPNQYQVLRIQPGQLTRWARQWDNHRRRWIADTRASQSGNDARVLISLPTPGWQEKRSDERTRRQDRRYSADQKPEDFAEQVMQVTRLDLGGHATVERRSKVSRDGERLDYLVAVRPKAPLRCIGVVDGRADQAIIEKLDAHVFSPLRTRGSDALNLAVVHHGPDDPALRLRALERGIRVKTWAEYNELLETGAYRTWLRDRLDRDKLYPQALYQPQRFHDIDRFGHANEVIHGDLLTEIYQAVLGEDGQFLLILGDAGFGKSFLDPPARLPAARQ